MKITGHLRRDELLIVVAGAARGQAVDIAVVIARIAGTDHARDPRGEIVAHRGCRSVAVEREIGALRAVLRVAGADCAAPGANRQLKVVRGRKHAGVSVAVEYLRYRRIVVAMTV